MLCVGILSAHSQGRQLRCHGVLIVSVDDIFLKALALRKTKQTKLLISSPPQRSLQYRTRNLQLRFSEATRKVRQRFREIHSTWAKGNRSDRQLPKPLGGERMWEGAEVPHAGSCSAKAWKARPAPARSSSARQAGCRGPDTSTVRGGAGT